MPLDRPAVTVNCAASIDGKISTVRRRRIGISDATDIERVMGIREEHDAVAVGVGTILADDPSLTSRREGKGGKCAKIVFDSRGRTPADAKVLKGGRTYIITSSSCRKIIGNAVMLRCGERKVDISKAMNLLYKEGIRSVLVEGGGEIIFELARLGLVDRLLVYTSPVIIGGRDAPTLADGEGFKDESDFARFSLVSVGRAGEGILSEYERRSV